MTTARPTTVRLQHMVRAYRESATLMAALELGLFTKLARGADCEDTLLTALGIQPLHGERPIIACTPLALIELDGDRPGRLTIPASPDAWAYSSRDS